MATVDVDRIVSGQMVDRIHLQQAKELRREPTHEEELVWEQVRRNGLSHRHYRRQQLIDGFIVDYYCHSARLIVEIDGGIHEHEREYDAAREAVLTARGLRVIRFRNAEVREDLDAVVDRIRDEVLKREGGLRTPGHLALVGT